MKRVDFWIPETVEQALKETCAKTGKGFDQVVEAAVWHFFQIPDDDVRSAMIKQFVFRGTEDFKRTEKRPNVYSRFTGWLKRLFTG